MGRSRLAARGRDLDAARRRRAAARGGQDDHEHRPARRVLLDPDRPPVGLDQALHDRQAEAGAASVGPRLVRLVEAIEHVWQVLGRDALAGVAHAHHDRVALALRVERHRSAARRVPERVGREVLYHLLEAARITGHGVDAGPDRGVEGDAGGLGLAAMALLKLPLVLMVDNRQRLHGYTNQINAIYAFDADGRLPQITTPTLILTGKDDALVVPENSHRLAARIPGARLIEFEHAGHLFFMEKADEVNHILREFLLG